VLAGYLVCPGKEAFKRVLLYSSKVVASLKLEDMLDRLGDFVATPPSEGTLAILLMPMCLSHV